MHVVVRTAARHLSWVSAIALLAAVGLLPTVAADDPGLEFELGDHRGRQWTMKDFQDKQLVAFVFLGTECPLAKLYAGRLAELHREFADRDVAIVGVNANTQDSLTEIGNWVRHYQLPFPVLKDRANRLADRLQAERTPEAILVDADGKVRYRGRIDDQYLIGKARNKVQRRDLAIAIEELLDGKEVSIARTEPIGCHIGRVREYEPHGEITYSTHIAAIFNRRCMECHREGEIAPFQLTNYDDVTGWEDTILEVIAENRMPPWFANPDHGVFANDARLSSDEKQLIRTWVSNGMPQGDPSELPDPPQFTTGWRMPKPDQVIHMREEAYTVPAEGVVDYQYFQVDPGWDEDKYIWASEARPDKTSVVHHIIAYVILPGDDARDGRKRKMLVGYAPGADPNVFEDGIAIHVPAGSKLVFEMHYTPNGTATEDRSYIGLKFMDRKDVRKLLRGGLAADSEFEIPPNNDNYIVTAEYRSRRDELLLEMTPHMHLRGKAFRYEATYPDGSSEILLDVPNYDFNWQLGYRLAEPKLLPKGTRILCTAAYDNSAANVANPNPNRTVTWGDQSFDEMMIGFLTTISADERKLTTARETP
jgi:peroxiredoxin